MKRYRRESCGRPRYIDRRLSPARSEWARARSAFACRDATGTCGPNPGWLTCCVLECPVFKHVGRQLVKPRHLAEDFDASIGFDGLAVSRVGLARDDHSRDLNVAG